MAVSRHQAMINYLQQFPPIAGKYLYFDTVTNKAGHKAISPIQQQTQRRDILGNILGQYEFAIVCIANLSNTTDSTNINNMDFVDQWIDWLHEQNYNGNFPDFGEDTQVSDIEPLSNMGRLAQTYDNGTGKYMFMCRVNYYKRKGV